MNVGHPNKLYTEIVILAFHLFTVMPVQSDTPVECSITVDALSFLPPHPEAYRAFVLDEHAHATAVDLSFQGMQPRHLERAPSPTSSFLFWNVVWYCVNIARVFGRAVAYTVYHILSMSVEVCTVVPSTARSPVSAEIDCVNTVTRIHCGYSRVKSMRYSSLERA